MSSIHFYLKILPNRALFDAVQAIMIKLIATMNMVRMRQLYLFSSVSLGNHLNIKSKAKLGECSQLGYNHI